MSSSDSEDDCYGNIAQKLQKIKSTFVKEKVANVVVFNDSNEHAKTSETLAWNVDNSSENIADLNTSVNSTDNDEFSLDAIIAKNIKAKPSRGRGRGSKRKATSDTEPAGRETRSTRRRTSNSTRGRTNPAVPEPSSAPLAPHTAAEISETLEEIATTAALRGRGSSARGRRSRGRTRGRGGSRRELWALFDEMFDHRRVNSNPLFSSTSSNSSANYPTYSVGNTDEYPDQSDNQQLFSARPVTSDVEVIEDDPLEVDNEEMSVKVYWQSLEIFKFKIRKYQKLTQIFEYFTEKEGVSNEKLLFTYNEKILKIDDTPDSINYSIAKFIDGGIVNQNITHLAQERCKEEEMNGLKLKFQCQNKKKPFETLLKPTDKFVLAMMKCAEHLETPLERLKFYFDGDLITNKSTPQDLELEGGECIDVKIISS